LEHGLQCGFRDTNLTRSSAVADIPRDAAIDALCHEIRIRGLLKVIENTNDDSGRYKFLLELYCILILSMLYGVLIA